MNPFIESLISKLEKGNFSPLEIVIYAYDFVTDDDMIIEKSTAMQEVLSLYRINNTIKDDKVIVFINDNKYTISGIYLIDTFDKNIYSRYSFLCPKQISEINNYIFTNEQLMKFDMNNSNNIDSSLVEQINMLSVLVDEKEIIKKEYNYSADIVYSYNKQQVIINLSRYISLSNRRITADDLIEALLVVRKNQLDDELNDYPLSKDDFVKTVVESNWKFFNRNESLLFNLFHINVNAKNEALSYFENNNIEEEINNVKMRKKVK